VVAEKLAQPVGDDIGGQGTPLHVVSEVLGHASIAITKDVYGRLTCVRGSQRGSQSGKKPAAGQATGL
jgi:integrase